MKYELERMVREEFEDLSPKELERPFRLNWLALQGAKNLDATSVF